MIDLSDEWTYAHYLGAVCLKKKLTSHDMADIMSEYRAMEAAEEADATRRIPEADEARGGVSPGRWFATDGWWGPADPGSGHGQPGPAVRGPAEPERRPEDRTGREPAE